MKGREFAKAIEGLGLSQVEAARLFGTYPSTVRRWVSGELSVPWAVYLVLWLIEKYKLNVEEMPRKPTRAEQERLDMEYVSNIVGGGPVAFTRRQPPEEN
jgi:hypothetical protein